MTHEPNERDMAQAMRSAFAEVTPSRDLVSSARVAGTRMRLRHQVGMFAAATALFVLVMFLAGQAGDDSSGGTVGGVSLWLIWVIVACGFAIAEVLTTNLVLIMIAAAAVPAAAVAGVGGPPWLQVIVFTAGSCTFLLGLRPTMRRRLDGPASVVRTGVDALIGQDAVVMHTVDHNGGVVEVGGEQWSAQPLQDEVLPAGSVVQIVEIRGATAVVWQAITGLR